MRSVHRHLAATAFCTLLFTACGGSGREAPAIPGAGAVAVQDPMLAALGLQLFRYGSGQPPALPAAPVIDQATYRQDSARRAFIPEATVAADYRLLWELSGINPGDHTAAKGSPAVINTSLGPRIVVGVDSGMVYCLDAEGALAWSAYTHPSRRGIHGTPAIADGTIYIGAYDGAMYAFALDSGALRFRTQIGGSIGSSPLVHDGRVYVSVETPKPSGIMAILDARTGEILWRDDGLRDHPHSSVALDPDRNVMVVGDNSGDLTAWDVEPQRRRFVYRAGGPIKGPILLHDGAAIFGSWDRHVHAVDLTTGKARWKTSTGNRVMSGAAYSPETGLIYIGSHDQRLYALRPGTGAVAWSFLTGARIVSSPVVAGRHVLFGSHDRHLYALDAASGALTYRFEARGEVSSSPALLGDRILLTERRTDEFPGSLYLLAPVEARH